MTVCVMYHVQVFLGGRWVWIFTSRDANEMTFIAMQLKYIHGNIVRVVLDGTTIWCSQPVEPIEASKSEKEKQDWRKSGF